MIKILSDTEEVVYSKYGKKKPDGYRISTTADDKLIEREIIDKTFEIEKQRTKRTSIFAELRSK